MPNNFQLSYNVDLVLCIDCTESMDNILNIVKEKALSLYHDIQSGMRIKGKEVNQLRVRLVAFRDYVAFADEQKRHLKANEPMLVTNFFSLPEESNQLSISVQSLYPIGGGDEQEDGLEALAYAIRSDWNTGGTKNRHVIVVWTDAEPHSLGEGRGTIRYPRGMAENFGELSEWWDGVNYGGYMPNPMSKRLILFTPDSGAWKKITENWDNVIHFPSKAGNGLREVDYQTILNCIVNTIG